MVGCLGRPAASSMSCASGEYGRQPKSFLQQLQGSALPKAFVCLGFVGQLANRAISACFDCAARTVKRSVCFPRGT
eukprot:2485510-Amphidinium_carterae.1